MPSKKTFFFIFQAIVIGLAVALFIILFIQFKTTLQPTAPKPSYSNAPTSYADAVSIATPAVVNIYTKKVVVQRLPRLLEDPFIKRFFGDRLSIVPRKRLESSLGSGVIISKHGYILTNHHVIAGANEIQVALLDGRIAQASIVGTDPDTDIAVLHIKLPELPSITISRAEHLRVGDVVLAIGNPFGIGQTVTQGIISATGRNRLGISIYENFIQTDAAINPGNSGGALINPDGELIGINTAIFSKSGGSQGIGFAIPMSIANKVMAQIIQYGQALRGWIGIELQTLTPELASSFNAPNTEGVIVTGIFRNGPAHKAGLRPSDIITHIQSRKVTDPVSAILMISEVHPTDKLTLQVIRKNQKIKLEMMASIRPKRLNKQN